MKIKKIALSLVTVMTFAIVVLAQNLESYAEVTNTPIYLGVTELRTKDVPNMGYSIGDPDTNGITGVAAKIWNIVKYSSLTSNDPTEANMYCLKAGVGFTENASKRAAYNLFFDMKTQREQIKAQNEVLASIVDGNVDLGDGTTESKYNSILAAIDMLYLPGEVSANEKVQFLEAAKCNQVDGYDLYPLTDDDIDAVQQAVLWYFTNYNEENGKYDKYDEDNWLYYTIDGNVYKSLQDYKVRDTDEGIIRSNQAIQLYRYMIDTAKANASKYSQENLASRGAPAKVNTTTLNYTESGNNYIVGPINITEESNNTIPYDIDFTVSNGATATANYKLLDKDKNEVASGKTVKDLVGENFYISIAKDSATTISTNIKIKYKNTKMTLWASTTNNQEQPILIPEKEQIEVSTDLTVTPDSKIFDLSLRKYITKVNGVELSAESSRVPSIDTTSLASGTTATYKHKKDPILVEEGSKVTYKLTVYNEGQKNGRATKLVDQLPTGLKFSKVVSGNFELDTYSETDNKLALKRKAGNTDNLTAYTSGNTLSSETIEVECEVTATPDTKNQKILTNVAWISEEFDAESNITITNQKGADRDSEPSTVPSVNKDNMSNYTGNNNKTDLTDSTYYYKGQQDDDDFEKLVLLPQSFDLKLIKRIVSVNGTNVPERIESIDVSKLNIATNAETTADYKLNKDPVLVKKGDIVKYTFRVYNEGDIDGYASEITEDIPEGLEFVWSAKEGTELAGDTTLTSEEKQAIEFNQQMLWGNFQYNTDKSKITMISTDYLSKENETTPGSNLIKAFGSNDGTKTEKDLSYKEVSVMLKVVAEDISGTVIRNEAEISEDTNSNGDPVDDRDSDTEVWKKYEDDEDYDNIKLQSFDLALRKFIIAVSPDTTIEDSEYLKTNGSYTRAPIVDTSKLNKKDENGNLVTTATYNHTKKPLNVKIGDNVVYMLRVYNEGDMDGYAAEIKDHLPSYLEFVEGDFNNKYGWTVSSNGRTVTSTYLADSLIGKASENTEGTIVLKYQELPIMCKVKDTAKINENITNIADITIYKDENKKDVNDRDSEANNVVLPSDKDLPNYKDDEKGTYVPGQQDDDDFEKVNVLYFDLALRKFITGVNDTEVTNRVPQVSAEGDVLETHKLNYNHTKEPVEVVSNDTVIYTIRVYNEGQINGYAKQVKDDIPAGLEFLPDNELNKTMRWTMLDKDGKETTDKAQAVSIATDYLSKEQEKTAGANLIKAFDSTKAISDTNPDYKDVKVAFKVVEPNTSDKIIINSAQISDDSDEDGKDVTDIDSTPDKWNEGEDDQDKEYIKLTYFDLALRKWVTQAIVIEDGVETVTNTGHDPWDDPEEIVKVELNRKKLSSVIVKFRYSIRVYNQGDIAGYAKEITDYIPEGLKFVAEDNPGWTDKGNNVISTRLLENTLLQPGEYADVEVLLTWINASDNTGLKVNTAEISEDYNDKGVPDIDSTPNNQKKGEDDIDDAPVLLSISTGLEENIALGIGIGFTVLVTLAGGVVLIKKFVL